MTMMALLRASTNNRRIDSDEPHITGIGYGKALVTFAQSAEIRERRASEREFFIATIGTKVTINRGETRRFVALRCRWTADRPNTR